MSSFADIAKRLNKEFKDEGFAVKSDVKPHYERL